ncbi:peptidase domain-containing ABC transporter [Methylobacterium komagatae]|uniref:Peptidase domain-containing ABC transporter n=1 Tax=Methylobacterium komagatae TaxID=374425 RepID=A0ABW2BN10_9HYPH
MFQDHKKRINDLNEEPHSSALLSSLVVIARSHGLHLTTAKICKDNNFDASKINKQKLKECANKSGLKSKHLTLSWSGLQKIERSLPVIVFLGDGTPLLLRKVLSNSTAEQVQLQNPDDPDDIYLTLDRVKFEEIWAGEIMLFRREYGVKDESQPFGMGLIATLMFRDRNIIRDITLSALFLSLLTLVPILFFRLMTDRVLMHHALSTFIVLSIALGICIIFETLFSFVRRALMNVLITRIDVKLSTLVFERVLRQPVDLFERTPVGLIARNMSEISKIRAFLSNQLLGTLLDGICLVVFIPVMFMLSPVLTGIVLSCCVVIALWTMAMLPVFAKRSSEAIAADGLQRSFLIQTLQGIRTIKSLALESRQIYQYESYVAKTAKLRMKEGNLANLIQSTILPIERFMVSGTMAIGVYLAMTATDPSNVAELFVFLLLSQRVVGPMRQMAQLVEQYEEAKSSVQLVSSLVNNPAEDQKHGQGVRSQIQGQIEFADVTFKYPGATSPTLKNAKFVLQAGQTLGVMGRSGSGKTTITRLLQRLHNDFDGMIKIDGIDIREYALDHLRSSLGVVLQDNFLFAGSVRDNITAAKVSATFEEVVRASRLAGAEEFIERLPQGYDTLLNEGSTNLSGGQRQRIAIARALITDPRILILDEATSALDPDSEAIVNENLQKIAANRSVIVISHRLSSLVSSDAILVLEKGHVEDVGRHTELLNRCDIYRELWNRQNPPTTTLQEPRLRLVN